MLALNHLSSRLLSARAAHAETQQRLQFLDQACYFTIHPVAKKRFKS